MRNMIVLLCIWGVVQSQQLSLPRNSQKLNEVVTLHYEIKGDYLELGVTSNRLVYTGIGFGAKMDNADIVTIEIIKGKVVLTDRFSTEYDEPPSDKSLGCSEDYELLNSSISGQSYSVVFRRKLDTGDRCDKPVIQGINQVIWAHGENPELEFHDLNGGRVKIDFSK